MPTATKQHPTLTEARAALATPIDFETFLNKLSAKDRTNAQRHVAACDAEGPPSDGKHGALWRRLACALMTLAPHAIKFNGQQSAQFFIPDGKYRMQVFALEDLRDGKINIYCPNVLDDAVAAGLLARRADAATGTTRFVITGTDQALDVTELDGATPNPAAFYKDMLGWNRKAIRITLAVTATNPEIEAAEQLCAISSKKWQPKAA
ncbi:MAG TPA: hypothetical protein VER17_01630 [Tepidisphaeraceae bacterium]|nr:hypothetical protein [Tepidisphaeraceae bacterium]